MGLYSETKHSCVVEIKINYIVKLLAHHIKREDGAEQPNQAYILT